MNRERFIKLCESSDRRTSDGENLSLSIEVKRDRYSEYAVYLCGSWGEGCITQRELYRPTPGNQGRDCYINAMRKCEELERKFSRWLEFYCDYVMN
jgi:hypothetical protein